MILTAPYHKNNTRQVQIYNAGSGAITERHAKEAAKSTSTLLYTLLKVDLLGLFPLFSLSVYPLTKNKHPPSPTLLLPLSIDPAPLP